MRGQISPVLKREGAEATPRQKRRQDEDDDIEAVMKKTEARGILKRGAHVTEVSTITKKAREGASGEVLSTVVPSEEQQRVVEPCHHNHRVHPCGTTSCTETQSHEFSLALPRVASSPDRKVTKFSQLAVAYSGQPQIGDTYVREVKGAPQEDFLGETHIQLDSARPSSALENASGSLYAATTQKSQACCEIVDIVGVNDDSRLETRDIGLPQSSQTCRRRRYIVLSSDEDSDVEGTTDSAKQGEGSTSLDCMAQKRSVKVSKLSPASAKVKEDRGISAIKRAPPINDLRHEAFEGEKEDEVQIRCKGRRAQQDCMQNGKAEEARPREISPELSDPSLKVKRTLRIYNSLYLRYLQEDQGRCIKEGKDTNSLHLSKGKRGRFVDEFDDNKRKSRRPDLKAITEMRNSKTLLHTTKVIGHVPGVSIGDQFFSRCEMIAIGLHDHWLSGIVSMGTSYRNSKPQYRFPIAVSLVLSGVYEDDVDNSEDVVYTGQGGNDFSGKKRQVADQTMVHGNLALKNSMEQNVPVRLIRGHKTKKSHKVYTYDGLYKVIEYWRERGISGFSVLKFRLHRVEGQPILTTDQVHFCGGQVPSNPAELKGLVSLDISNGLEPIPVPASNVIDDPPFPPSGFKYLAENEVDDRVPEPLPARGCNCREDCTDVTKCACAVLNMRKFPYVRMNGGLLVEPVDVVYECGPQCACGPQCSNRVTQRGLYYRLEVFRTASKGWAVRSWDSIPAGAPVCEYTGLLMRTEDADHINENDYIFDLDCVQTMKGLGVRQRRLLLQAEGVDENNKDIEKDNLEGPEYCIDAGSSGNVSRFINHSCEPNLFVQCVLNTHHDLTQPRVFLFASDNIHPLQELTYDYGYELDSVVVDGKVKILPCYCGTPECRKRLY